MDTPEKESRLVEERAERLECRTNTPLVWSTSFLMGFQHTMVCIAGILVIPHLVADLACAGQATIELRAQLISSTLVISGVMTLLQTTVGLRLAILNGPAFAFIPPLYAFARQPEMKCRWTSADVVPEEEYVGRLRMVISSIALAGFVQLLFGATGLIGIVARRVGPLTICSLLLLLCIGNCPIVLEKAALHWLSLVQFGLLLLFIMFVPQLNVSLPAYTDGGLKLKRVQLFGTFPYLIAIIITWLLAFVLTAADVLPAGNAARVDRPEALSVLKKTPWIQIPYVGQFGGGSVSVGLFLGLLSSCLACSIESLGAYKTLASVAEERPPPPHSINRATLIQGLGCLLSGLMGCGVGITAYSENVAVVSITRLASRRIMQAAGGILIVLGVFTKFAALAAVMPEPMVGGVFGMSVCLVAGVSLSNLKSVDLKSSRNLSVLGLAIILGIVVPTYAEQTPISTRMPTLNQMLNILLTTRMFVGGLIAFILDNTTPKPKEEAVGKQAEVHAEEISLESDGYAFPPAFHRFLDRIPTIHYLPFIPPKETQRIRRPNAHLIEEVPALSEQTKPLSRPEA